MAIEIRIGGDCASDMPEIKGIRYTSNRSLVRRAFHGVPQWVTEHMTGGTVHNLETCEACAIAKALRERFGVDSSSNHVAELSKEYETNKREQDAEYLVDDQEASQAMVRDAQRRQTDRILRVALRCPVKRLPDVMRELAAMHDQHNALGHAQSAHMVRACAMALDIAMTRWDAVQQDAVEYTRLRLHMAN